MPNDNMLFPPRFIGYGAYNLCFDKDLGKASASSKDFFQYVHDRAPAVNLVKVICFRRATLEGLPRITYDSAGAPNGRTQPLFKLNKKINPGFLDNLLALVKRAKELNFWVQVCIFHEHAVKVASSPACADKPEDKLECIEDPENVPDILNPRLKGNGETNCQRLTNFFNIVDAERHKQQLSIVSQIAGKLRWETNVLFEIANEVRIQGCAAADNKTRNCKIVPWLNSMSDAILSAIFWDFEPDGVSTVLDNEAMTFARQRPIDGCSEERFQPAFFDFHSGQWKASDEVNVYTAGIEAAKQRVLAYRNSPPTTPRAHLIINDDGQNWDDEDTPPEMIANANRIKKWAGVAFSKGLSYASKQQYPPGRQWDNYALDALQYAHDHNPIPQ